jgi:hypothetical protein
MDTKLPFVFFNSNNDTLLIQLQFYIFIILLLNIVMYIKMK